MKNYIILFVLFIAITSCKRTLDGGNLENDITHFRSCILPKPFEIFPSSIYKKENFAGVINPSALYADGYCVIFFKHNFHKSKFVSVSSELKNKSIFKSVLLDTINCITPNFKEDNNYSKFPVPNFEDTFFSFVDKLKVDDSLILGFRNEKGQYFNQKGIEQIQKTTKLNTLELIGKGYSNGVVIDNSSKTIIYWIMIW